MLRTLLPAIRDDEANVSKFFRGMPQLVVIRVYRDL